MAISVVMPALEMAQETGKLVQWLKKEGEQVKKGDMLLEVETDKAVVEIEAQGDGVLGGVTAKVGDVIPVGQTIGWLLKAGEQPPTVSATAQSGRKMEAAPAAAAAAAATAAPQAPSAAGARISPKARKLAREHGVDIATVRGSGPGGEILADDIIKAASAASAAPAVAKSAPAPAPPAAPAIDSRRAPLHGAPPSPAGTQPLSSIGKIMAERTTQSWKNVPHFFVMREVDASALNATRERLIPVIEQSHGVKVTHTDLMVAAVGRALSAHRRINAFYTDDGVTMLPEVNVALAMAVENAVVTAVIRNADTASLGDIAKRRKELADRARANKLQPADIQGATFTISNLGMFSVDAFTAIIVPPQAGILAVGAIKDRVVAVGRMIAIRPMLTLTLSSDHRVVDGARAAQFLDEVATLLESPESLV
jgi:pyruvate dehydrogenase E2 component (dihydrolipoamide acetyltransferase)